MKDRTAAPPADTHPRGRPTRAEAGDPPASQTAADDLPREADDDGAALSERVDLTGLSVAGITKRRVGWVAAGLLAVWIVVVFARQVGDATTATNRATDMAAANAALTAEVEALQNEVALIVRPEYVGQQARGHGLGTSREIPFTLDPTVAPPVDGAPGSASVRLGSIEERETPLEAWLSLLFGPG